MRTFPNGIYIGRYKGVNFYTTGGTIQCLFGWMPMEFSSIHAFKCAVTRREKEED
jgi:hypothetical protein